MVRSIVTASEACAPNEPSTYPAAAAKIVKGPITGETRLFKALSKAGLTFSDLDATTSTTLLFRSFGEPGVHSPQRVPRGSNRLTGLHCTYWYKFTPSTYASRSEERRVGKE